MAWEWVGPTATAVVGVTGMFATVWTGSRQRDHQLQALRLQAEHQRRQEVAVTKRLAYVQFLKTAQDALSLAYRLGAGIRAGGSTETDMAQLDEDRARFGALIDDANAARMQLSMFCPVATAEAAHSYLVAIHRVAAGEEDASENQVRASLLIVVRYDLEGLDEKALDRIYEEQIRELGLTATGQRVEGGRVGDSAAADRTDA